MKEDVACHKQRGPNVLLACRASTAPLTDLYPVKLAVLKTGKRVMNAWTCLDLLLGAGGDVGDGPAGLLLDALLLAGLQQV